MLEQQSLKTCKPYTKRAKKQTLEQQSLSFNEVNKKIYNYFT